VCAFLKGKAHEVQGTHETPQEIGDVGHPAVVAGIELKSALTPLCFSIDHFFFYFFYRSKYTSVQPCLYTILKS
jgi:hypothetical protein